NFGVAELYLFPATLALAVGSGERRDQLVSLLAGSVDTLNEIRHITLQAGRGVFERANRPRIEIVFQKQNLIVKSLEDRLDLVFSTTHGPHVDRLARFCITQHQGVLRL